LRTRVCDQRSTFTWGGGCALHDKATRKRKLPDLAPDPFREREELLQKLLAGFAVSRGKRRVAFTDEFILKGLAPFFAAFFHHAGFDLEITAGADQATLKSGIQSAMVPFCAPMQLFHGMAERMAASGADWLFVPMLRSVPRPEDLRCSVVCPIVQAAPDVLRCTLESRPKTPRLLSPRIDFGDAGMESEEFLASCRGLAKDLGLRDSAWREAWRAGATAQRQFDAACAQMGRRALDFCKDRNLVPVVVLGRNYSIHNRILNSNVPAILREQGAIGIPADCYPLDADSPLFPDMYWGYGQTILRAAHQVRRAAGVYALYCSNYSCGPDSFNLHFAAYVMEGKPFAIIETDGHCGDAGTKTRVEAFLHCVEEDRRAARSSAQLNDFVALQSNDFRLRDLVRHNGSSEKLLIPHLGSASETVAAVLRGLGFPTEALPAPDTESLRLGRRYTSGKECLPMPMTLGTLLRRLERSRKGERFVYVMPNTDGPCRFGVYNLLNRIVLERLGWRDRLRIWSPNDSGYFDDLPAGAEMLLLAGFAANDVLLQALLDVRPFERTHGAAEALYKRCFTELLAWLEAAGSGDLALAPALWQVATGKLFGLRELLEHAGAEFAKLRGPGERPVVELTGEIYVRAVAFSNDFLIKKLEARGLRVRVAPQVEWLAYCSYVRRHKAGRNRFADRFSDHVQHRIEATALAALAPHLGWPKPPSVKESLDAATPYVSSALEGEAVLTIGASLEAWRRKQIDAVIAVGPLECMPTKIAEAQFQHLAERESLLSLTLAFNGEPISDSTLDNFAFEVLGRFHARRNAVPSALGGRARPTNPASTRTVTA
jgi:predicted nucleotide-binding protein (sugar kinase/HSP70/actin superfamily)